MSTSHVLVGSPVLVLLLVVLPQVTFGGCNETSGPPGNVACLWIDGYSGRQYATCLTNTYVILKSKGIHSCQHDNPLSVYCYYQCMLEVYDKEDGTVSPDCQCSQNNTVSPDNTVSPSCYSPAGTDCAWYQNCLEKKFSCSGGFDSYVMAFSQKLCGLAEKNSANVTQAAVSWANATSKCLQVELAPLLLPFESFTCANVSTYAYTKQKVCYSDPYVREPGLCTVTSADFWKIFWSLRNSLKGFVESLLGLLKTRLNCKTGTALRLDSNMYLLNVRLRLYSLSRRKRDSVSDLTASADFRNSLKATHSVKTLDTVPAVAATSARFRRGTSDSNWQGETSEMRVYHGLANEVAVALERQLGWVGKEVIWFAYARATTDKTALDAQILLADRHAYGLQVNAWSPRANMTQVAVEAGRTLNSTNLVLNSRIATMQFFQACSDFSCQQVVLDIWGPTSRAVTRILWVHLPILIVAEILLLFLTIL